MLTFGSLFAGIGGFDLGLERAGMVCKWQVEKDPFCLKVLTKHWPDIPKYGDIKTINWSEVERVDCICGGFPCQPVSVGGKKLGEKDERWLWPEFHRAICAIRPNYVIVENVPGLFLRGFGSVLRDLAASGYHAEWDVLPAAAIGAPHVRERVILVAYPEEIGRTWYSPIAKEQRRPKSVRGSANVENANSAGLERHECRILANARGGRYDANASRSTWWDTEPDVDRMADGVSARMDGRRDRLEALGNAVVPQVAQFVGQCVIQHATQQPLAAELPLSASQSQS